MRVPYTQSSARLATSVRAASFLAAMLVGGACSEAPDATEEVTERTSAVITSYHYTDVSGKLQFSVSSCTATPAAAGLRCAYCPVEAGYIIIGGGAQILNSPSSARLKTSRPDSYGPEIQQACTGDAPATGASNDIWLVRSYSAGSTTHQVQAYAVGLKVSGMSETALRPYIGAPNENTTGSLAQPTMDLAALPGKALVGGGAELLGPDANGPYGYLTKLNPVDPNLTSSNAFRATAIFDGGKQGYLKVFAIGIDWSLPIPGGSSLRAVWRSVTSSTGTGYRTASVNAPFPYAFASPGASRLVTPPQTRYLSDIILPMAAGQGVTASTNDESANGTGATIAYASALAAFNWEPYWFNTIAFIINGGNTVFSRPAGAAPVNLQQSTDAPTTDARHWHLESMPNNRYRIRNGNPQQGTECAARQASAPGNVKVLACGSSDDFLYTIDFGGLADSFRLRNVANGRCIDNLGSATTSDLVFRTCPASDVYQASMELVLWSNNWP